jgi:S1-C subfamily serine protease
VNLLDVFLVVVAVAALLHGLALGAVAQLISFAGLAGGLALSVVVAPWLRSLSGDPTVRLGLVVGTLLVVPAVTTTLARTAGVGAWRLVQRARLGAVDAAGGAAIAVVATLLVAWLVAGMLSRLPDPTVTTEIQQSTILRRIDAVMPAPPAIFSRIGRLLDPLGFPDVFAQFEPTPPADLPPAADPVVRAAVERDAASVVRIEGAGCGDIQEGSGFVVAADMVVTNAHVVAGVARPVVLDGRGPHAATAVLFDPRLDVAVLRAADLAGRPLPLAPATVPRGTAAVVMGYPGGGPFRAGGAAVLARTEAVGRDIYGRGLAVRSIYQLHATIRPGNSGGPAVGADGAVIGVVFARSTSDPTLGFALTADEVEARIRPTLQRPVPTATGGCAA